MSTTPRATCLRDLFVLDAIPLDDTTTLNDSSGAKPQIWCFKARFAPSASGSIGRSAYGGSTLASTLIAASRTIPNESYHVYSFTGNFLGPASIHAPLHFTVHETRSTSSYASRYVQVFQDYPSSAGHSRRQVLAALVDFQRTQPKHDFFDFSKPPESQLRQPSDASLVAMDDLLSHLWPAATIKGFKRYFCNIFDAFESKLYPDSIHTFNAYGELKGQKTPQDGKPITDKKLDMLFRAREPLYTDSEKAAATMYALSTSIRWADNIS